MNLFSDNKYFPLYVSEPVEDWLNECDRARTDVEMYSGNFLQTFENSFFYEMCRKTVKGKLQWKEWNHCSVSCGGGFQRKIAVACIPHYTACNGIQILEQPCNENACPHNPSKFFPARVRQTQMIE